jgi:hypothetical protein
MCSLLNVTKQNATKFYTKIDQNEDKVPDDEKHEFLTKLFKISNDESD